MSDNNGMISDEAVARARCGSVRLGVVTAGWAASLVLLALAIVNKNDMEIFLVLVGASVALNVALGVTVLRGLRANRQVRR